LDFSMIIDFELITMIAFKSTLNDSINIDMNNVLGKTEIYKKRHPERNVF
jgi:hypothetical protein